jgi:hypothetical protein
MAEFYCGEYKKENDESLIRGVISDNDYPSIVGEIIALFTDFENRCNQTTPNGEQKTFEDIIEDMTKFFDQIFPISFFQFIAQNPDKTMLYLPGKNLLFSVPQECEEDFLAPICFYELKYMQDGNILKSIKFYIV